MKDLSAVLLAAIVILSGCSAPLGRPAAAGSSAPLASCNRGGSETPNGGMSCMDRQEFRCSNGAWQATALRCEP
jgi:hypothetical protein